jgi:hypothetical protein
VEGFATTALVCLGVAAVQRSCHTRGVTAGEVVQALFAEFVWARLSATRFRLLSMEAAALILAR